MPPPLSTTRIRSAPPWPMSTSMRVLPASTAFSSNSLTTLAGRSITSPAAIFVTTRGGNCWMRGMRSSVNRGGLPGDGLHAPLLDLALQRRRLQAQPGGGRVHIAVRLVQRLADLVLQLPLLDVAVQRALADAQQA